MVLFLTFPLPLTTTLLSGIKNYGLQKLKIFFPFPFLFLLLVKLEEDDAPLLPHRVEETSSIKQWNGILSVITLKRAVFCLDLKYKTKFF